jgi:alpha,alpha-trehalase
MWDELFIFPFLNLRIPILTRSLLRYRYRRLAEARRMAEEAGHRGAMYPWQSGSNGREESQKIHLNPMSGSWIADNSYRQRHINAAIAYNVWQYYQVTEDREFLYYYGAELLIETARFWASLATHDPVSDRYDIKGVMGPDEFHTAYPEADPRTAGGLDNNAYTNVMVSWALTRTLDAFELLPATRCRRLREALGVSEEETREWDDISRKLRVPFHGDGIISQFEGYSDLEEFDWEGYAREYGDIQRLDRILEKEGDSPNRYKASKQADVLMLFYLFSADEMALIFDRLGYPFDPRAIPKNVDYYMSRTSHGSTLSWDVHAWVLARGDRARSWELFCRALNSDFQDIQGGTTPEGIHLGAMAGTVDVIQRCFTGIETRANVLHFDPALPDGLNGLRTTVRYRGHILDVEVDHERLKIGDRPATVSPITVAYRGRVRDVAPGDTYEFRLIKPSERIREHDKRNELPKREIAGTKG